MPTSRELLEQAETRLGAAGVPSPQVDAELLLAHVTGRPRALLRTAVELPADQVHAFAALLERRSTREPLQHLTGTAPFRYLELAVGPGVFVPRPETELLVDAVLAHLGGHGPGAREDPATPELVGKRPLEGLRGHEFAGGAGGAHRQDPAAPPRRDTGSGPHLGEPGTKSRRAVVVDLCTGTGALALALATEVPGSVVHAVELDPAAAGWTRRNLDRYAREVANAGSDVRLVVADATRVAGRGGPLADLRTLVDVLVTNPPYVPDDAIPRDPEVRDHDPAVALFGGRDGLDVVRQLVGQAARLLRPGGLLVIEHADVQGDDAGPAGVPGVLRATSDWSDVADHADLAGRPRFTTALRSTAGHGSGALTAPPFDEEPGVRPASALRVTPRMPSDPSDGAGPRLRRQPVTVRFDTSDPPDRARGLTASVAALRRGQIVGIPVDLHYGLAADAFSERGVAAVRAAKGRPGLTLPVLVAHIPTVSGIARPSALAYQLMRDLWPGPLTLILPAQPTLAWSLTDPAGRVAVRQPLHPVALELLDRTGPLAVIGASAPATSPSTAFPPELAEQLTVILDGGELPGGAPSTVVNLSVEPPVVVREGAVSAEMLRAVSPDLAAP